MIHDGYMGLVQRAPGWRRLLNFHTVTTSLLLLFPVAFAAAFLFCGWLTALLGGTVSTAKAAGHFVLTLLPIAIVTGHVISVWLAHRIAQPAVQ